MTDKLPHEHEFIHTGQCRPRICKLCGENEPQIQHDLKVSYKGEELKFDKDFMLVDKMIVFKNPLF